MSGQVEQQLLDGSEEGANFFNYYRYTYAVYRAGIFHRFEDFTDGCDVLEDDDYHTHHGVQHHEHENNDATMSGGGNSSDDNNHHHLVHKLPLRLLHPSELYTVNDILGITTGPPDIDHIKVRQAYSSIGSLARKNIASANSSAASLYGASRMGSTSSGMNDAAAGAGGGGGVMGGSGKKKVGFVSQPPSSSSPRHHHRYDISSTPPPTKQQPVTLSSSDGLIVVSVFLPVHVTRSDAGEWSADWDYEALLSMQTHLRVTRVGTVKWRGWHGNVGGGASAESGVPVEERHKVEVALRPFNCVPVWVPTSLFGEM